MGATASRGIADEALVAPVRDLPAILSMVPVVLSEICLKDLFMISLDSLAFLFFDISDVRRTEFVVSSVLRPSHDGNEWNERASEN